MDINQFTVKILDSINEIYKKNNSEILDISLMNGISGLALANFVVGRKLNDEKYIQNSKDIIEAILEHINEDNYKLKDLYSYCNGFAGVCEVLNLFSMQGILDTDLNEDLEELDNFLYENAIVLFKKNNPDFLHGAMGILYYFSNRYDGNSIKIENYIDGLIEKYEEKAIIDERGVRIFNSILHDQEEGEFNFSLSHGLSGQAIIFLEIYKKRKSPSLLKLIEGIEKFISSYKKQPLSSNNIFNTYFPTFIVEKQDTLENKEDMGYSSRLAWCYGELNYALMYFKLYDVFSEEKYYEQAKIILENTITRNNPKDAKISSPFFCHGASGLIALNMFFSKKTDDITYKEIADYWLQYIGENFEEEILFHGVEQEPLSLLEGGTGLVLGLISLINNGDSGIEYKSEKGVYEGVLLLN
jgi:lantibiotic modifying enzyme